MNDFVLDTPPIRVGKEFRSLVRYSREQIIQFARLTGDTNPLHHDRQAAERACVVARGTILVKRAASRPM